MKKKWFTRPLLLGTAMVLGGISMTACSDDDDTSGDKYSPYISQVLDYRPAPGQFVNDLPKWSEGDTQESINKKVMESIGGGKNEMISLGGFGGYVIVGFDHTIENISGQRDFRILGNSFDSPKQPGVSGKRGGSYEPGIVMVAYDKNKNGKPDDDEWYELAGSEYHKETTVKNYRITYYRPDPDKTPVVDPDENYITDQEYIRWEDNRGGSGYMRQNHFSNHSLIYYPQWIDSESLTFEGTLLPPNGINEGTATESYWVLYAYDWGYADNSLNTEDGSTFDIGWAVDKSGNKVDLPGADFIKVYTGIHQDCGMIGETSTEVCGMEDLHLLNK